MVIYTVVECTTLESLRGEVQLRLDNNWLLQGGITAYPNANAQGATSYVTYMQAMRKVK